MLLLSSGQDFSNIYEFLILFFKNFLIQMFLTFVLFLFFLPLLKLFKAVYHARTLLVFIFAGRYISLILPIIFYSLFLTFENYNLAIARAFFLLIGFVAFLLCFSLVFFSNKVRCLFVFISSVVMFICFSQVVFIMLFGSSDYLKSPGSHYGRFLLLYDPISHEVMDFTKKIKGYEEAWSDFNQYYNKILKQCSKTKSEKVCSVSGRSIANIKQSLSTLRRKELVSRQLKTVKNFKNKADFFITQQLIEMKINELRLKKSLIKLKSPEIEKIMPLVHKINDASIEYDKFSTRYFSKIVKLHKWYVII